MALPASLPVGGHASDGEIVAIQKAMNLLLTDAIAGHASAGVAAQLTNATWNTGAGFADVAGSSITLTATGTRKVMLTAGFSNYMQTTNGTWQVRPTIDGSATGTTLTAYFNALAQHQGWSFRWLLSAPAAGARVFKLQWAATGGAGQVLTTDANDYITFTATEI